MPRIGQPNRQNSTFNHLVVHAGSYLETYLSSAWRLRKFRGSHQDFRNDFLSLRQEVKKAGRQEEASVLRLKMSLHSKMLMSLCDLQHFYNMDISSFIHSHSCSMQHLPSEQLNKAGQLKKKPLLKTPVAKLYICSILTKEFFLV